MYSASVLDMAVLFCFLDDQLTNLSPKSSILPDVLLLESWQSTRSTSAKALVIDPYVLAILKGSLDPVNPFIRSMQSPKGIVENVLVKIHNFIFPVDFIILDIIKEDKVPIILGRPMLSIAHSKINVFEKNISLGVGTEHDLEEVLVNEDINEDLGNFLEENRLLPNFDHQEAISFSLSSSSEIVKDSYRTSQDSNNNMSIGDFAIDDLWDDMDPRTLTRYNDHTKPEFFGTRNRVHQHNPYNLHVTFKIGFVNFNPYINPYCPFNIISRVAYNTIMTRELVYTKNNIVGLARNLNVFIGYHKFLIDFIVVENICEFVEK
nr:homeodomain-like protein [Tanacetum cinerariifolium]